jgi:hypothetical protein
MTYNVIMKGRLFVGGTNGKKSEKGEGECSNEYIININPLKTAEIGFGRGGG